MNRHTRIFVAGHGGLVGSAIVRRLQREGFDRLILRSRAELDLTDQAATWAFFAQSRPEVVILAAAKVGGIGANASYPADFAYVNLQIAANVIHAAHQYGVRKLLNLGSSCIYPRISPQPIPEDALLTGPLEPTNRAYAVAKIAAIEMCDSFRKQYGDDFISAMPTNLYGPNDNFDLETSHVLPAMIRKMEDARLAGDESVVLWGSGTPLREFLHVDDLADACRFLLEHVTRPGPINVGTGEEVSIRELAHLVQSCVGFDGKLIWDTARPDGTPRKCVDSSWLRRAGWSPKVSLVEGVEQTVRWYREQSGRIRGRAPAQVLASA